MTKDAIGLVQETTDVELQPLQPSGQVHSQDSQDNGDDENDSSLSSRYSNASRRFRKAAHVARATNKWYQVIGFFYYLQGVKQTFKAGALIMLGHGLEWYEFGLYGSLAHELGINYFHGNNTLSWVAFGLGLVSRVFGGSFFGWFSDTFGRRPAVLLTNWGMLIATAGQACLPTSYVFPNAFGEFGMYLFLLLRIMQGLAVGGELPSSGVYMIELSAKRSLGMSVGLLFTSSNVAFLIADGLVLYLQSTLTEQQMLVWGWRVPFILSLIPGSISLYLRKRMKESPVFTKAKECDEEAKDSNKTVEDCNDIAGTPEVELFPNSDDEFHKLIDDALSTSSMPIDVKDLGTFQKISAFFKRYSKASLVFGAGQACMASVYIGLVYMKSFMIDYCNIASTSATMIMLVSRFISFFSLIVVGYIVDLFGSSRVILAGSILTMVSGIPLFGLFYLSQGSPLSFSLWLMVANHWIISLNLVPFFILECDIWVTKIRSFGVASIHNTLMGILGGLSPLLAALLADANAAFGPGTLTSVLGLVSLVSSYILMRNPLSHLRVGKF